MPGGCYWSAAPDSPVLKYCVQCSPTNHLFWLCDVLSLEFFILIFLCVLSEMLLLGILLDAAEFRPVQQPLK